MNHQPFFYFRAYISLMNKKKNDTPAGSEKSNILFLQECI